MLIINKWRVQKTQLQMFELFMSQADGVVISSKGDKPDSPVTVELQNQAIKDITGKDFGEGKVLENELKLQLSKLPGDSTAI